MGCLLPRAQRSRGQQLPYRSKLTAVGRLQPFTFPGVPFVLQIDPTQREFRTALGCFATGITVITALGPRGELLGNTVNSFSSLSLDPPLILWCMGRHALSLKSYLSTDNFAVNVLSADQEVHSSRFAKSQGDKWAGVDYETWSTGCPILKGAAAVFECTTRHTYMGGDHVIFVGEVTTAAYADAADPLVFHKGKYRALAPLA
jgi:4-hydroxyphenylacetate 3-hydroxylase, reductase component